MYKILQCAKLHYIMDYTKRSKRHIISVYIILNMHIIIIISNFRQAYTMNIMLDITRQLL